jgi:nucleotide-binding universal stress UspA family protein
MRTEPRSFSLLMPLPELLTSPPRSDTDCAPIVVATDGHSHADPAILAAAFIAGHLGAGVRVLSVVEGAKNPCRQCLERAEMADVPAETRECGRQRILTARRAAVDNQLTLTVGRRASWSASVHGGSLLRESRRVIGRDNAQLLVIGQCERGSLRALEAPCGAMQLLTHSTVPVYIASATLRGLAQRVVVAMDFSAASIRAACTVGRLSAYGARIYLVHVRPRMPASAMPGRDVLLDEAREQLQRVEHQLTKQLSTQIESVILYGDVVTETLAFADGIQADVVACGRGRIRALPNRALEAAAAGTVTTGLLRRATSSLLVEG